MIFKTFPARLSLLITTMCFLSGCTMLSLRAKNPDVIGAVAESSTYLAKVITREIPSFGPEKHILEVGAGTGVFTEQIIQKLRPYDRLDVVELMPELCTILEEKFGQLNNVKIFCGDILEWSPPYRYYYIVSGLPFNSFPADHVEKITARYLELSEPHAACSFFEYKWLPSLLPIGMDTQEKNRFKATRAAIEGFVTRFEKSSASVYLNVPPAVVHFLEINKSVIHITLESDQIVRCCLGSN